MFLFALKFKWAKATTKSTRNICSEWNSFVQIDRKSMHFERLQNANPNLSLRFFFFCCNFYCRFKEFRVRLKFISANEDNVWSTLKWFSSRQFNTLHSSVASFSFDGKSFWHKLTKFSFAEFDSTEVSVVFFPSTDSTHAHTQNRENKEKKRKVN